MSTTSNNRMGLRKSEGKWCLNYLVEDKHIKEPPPKVFLESSTKLYEYVLKEVTEK